MAEQVADRFDRHELTPDEREQLYQEGVEWYSRYGVSDRPVPVDRAAFAERWTPICDTVLEPHAATAFVLATLPPLLLPKFAGPPPLTRHPPRRAPTRLVRRPSAAAPPAPAKPRPI